MTRTTNAARYASVAATAALVACLAATPAPARPDPGGGPQQSRADALHCPLRRIGTQLVRCDHLTGGGFIAPLAVPEYP
ncbi:MAG TPA: hypothetical protein VK875_08010 [Euzebyales bacterium]|nr:hypothetical protein [Euzebyales bacterium]